MLLILSVKYYHYCCVFLQSNRTALHEAAQEGSNKVITLLLHHGAGVDDIDNVSYHHMLLYWSALYNSTVNICISVFIIFSEIIVYIANYYSKH